MPPVNTLRDIGASSPEGAGLAPVPGPGHRVLLALVARRHYLEGRSKVEIAKETGLSRFKVARLIEEARESGVVRIDVVDDPEIDVEASVRLRSALGLAHAIVVPSEGEGAEVRTQLGLVAARFVTELLDASDVLGLPWSRSVHAMVERLTSLPRIEIVQLCGAELASDSNASAVEVVVRAARLAGTAGHVFFAPLIVADADTATALRREPQVRAALGRVDEVTTAVVGVGAWGPSRSTVYDACDAGTRAQVSDAGTVGEIAGVFFDARGEVLDVAVRERIVGVSGADLVRIPRVIALASGSDRADAVAAAARGGLVHGLVTDAALATKILRDLAA